MSSAKHDDEIISTDNDNEKRQILRDVEVHVCREIDRHTERQVYNIYYQLLDDSLTN